MRPEPPAAVAVYGLEASDLIPRVSGYLVRPGRLERGGLSAIRVLTLPSMSERTITPSMPDGPRFIHALGGPDRHGRIAFVQKAHTREPSLVKLIHVDGGGEREITSAPAMTPGGGHAWIDPGIGEHIAISPDGGHIAFVRDLRGRQMPRMHIQVGTLEIWEVDPPAKVCAESEVVDWGLTWFPDGRRIAFVKLLPRAHVPMPPENEPFGKTDGTRFAGWSELPALVALDVDTRETAVMAPGTRPVVSADGSEILARDFSERLFRLDLRTGTYSTIELPGIAGPVVASLPGGLVLYQSRPTAGQPVQRSPYGSFRAGIQMLPIKICDVSTGAFQTIIDAVDPRHQVSFGLTE